MSRSEQKPQYFAMALGEHVVRGAVAAGTPSAFLQMLAAQLGTALPPPPAQLAAGDSVLALVDADSDTCARVKEQLLRLWPQTQVSCWLLPRNPDGTIDRAGFCQCLQELVAWAGVTGNDVNAERWFLIAGTEAHADALLALAAIICGGTLLIGEPRRQSLTAVRLPRFSPDIALWERQFWLFEGLAACQTGLPRWLETLEDAALHGAQSPPAPCGVSLLMADFDGDEQPAHGSARLSVIGELGRRAPARLYRDPVSGLFNRAFYEHVLRGWLDAHWAHRPCALCMIDLDGLKSINQRWGYAAGDAAIARCGTGIVKATQQLPLEHYAVRWGGDEFLVFFAGQQLDEAQVRHIAQRLEQQLGGELAAGEPVVAFSMGTAYCGPQRRAVGSLVECLFRRAEEDLRRRKGS